MAANRILIADDDVQLVEALASGSTLDSGSLETAQAALTDAPSDDDSPHWVLSIDDDEDFTWALQRRLENHGVAVVRAFDGRDGCRTAFSRKADLILLDYHMPHGQGDFVLSQLKANPMTKDIPVVILTGRRDRVLEHKLLSLGAARYLTKPLNFDDLLSELRRHIDVLPKPMIR